MKKNIISIDTIILFLATLSVIKFVPAEIRLVVHPIVIFLLGIYLLIDVMLNARENNISYLNTCKFIIIILIISLLAIIPCLHRISQRHNGNPYEFAHDGGVIQTEEAIKYFIKGENPYHEDYYNTILDEHYTVYKLDEIKNSLIHHYTYLPLTFLFPIPFYFLSKATIGWFDMRFIYILMFGLSLYTIPKLAIDFRSKALLLITISLNPFFTYFLADGRNEIFLLFWLLMSFLFLMRDRLKTASVFLGLACVSKPTAWFLIPFFITYIWGKNNESENLGKKLMFLLKNTYPFILIFLIFILPFLILDFHSFKEDIFNWDEAYPLGGTPGYGFSNLLLFIGYSKSDYFPFKYLQLITGLPLLYFLLRRQLKNNTINFMLISYGILSFVLLYFSRFLHDNYLGYVFSVLCLGFFLEERKGYLIH
ncbi:MAG: hypothetical protein A3C43_00120 [Candidatus Schekmanbacteria bacterium RIFCSPHIGHO2_02_FULL_38_11]|uniref:Glycosyltransferase RgtA/B/C/D-like domain-containing protein n=1 Tax=Candidatus Schekmanbacteria bacterium RIFCSPLOWO2_12_FULL_38_15 TaxID=1817883 RepID=A0A1F7SN22_9BACT|nr:MAG: hypothetical protein A2043_09725 [Candidatus Schekmanbacteria bacterium GWA2_38_9]OGL51185.1 MAG: hypothetical protein A3H37_09195 [Candidatus Schekmanbacteria bacterium RIFCSPLOWO2_02_FULL_38_14]OGL54628.1 MAG: hypothetical protein A3G31_12160 [Candidatus Schekmanbacteria bacterium RIFCSPLOWO2_12_FULL_38_15]OGL54704.1 MAG: hypothetical protein A3C43_00120 [Candidatus Schekmanbacteria bacterium RIFCSPHIGHO2_02_FULL_38_11]